MQVCSKKFGDLLKAQELHAVCSFCGEKFAMFGEEIMKNSEELTILPKFDVDQQFE
jgi:hypothetical protein